VCKRMCGGGEVCGSEHKGKRVGRSVCKGEVWEGKGMCLPFVFIWIDAVLYDFF